MVAVKLALLAGLHTLDRAVGLPPCLLPFGVLVVARWRLTQGPVGVADLEALAVVLHLSGGLPPGTPTSHRLGQRAERFGEVGGLLQLGERGPLSGPQGQLPGDLAVARAEVVVVLQPRLVLLLRRPGFHLGLGGPLGLAGRQRPPGRVLHVLGSAPAPEQATPALLGMLGLDRGELLLGLVAPEGGALHSRARSGGA